MQLHKHTLNLRDGDFDYLATVYGPAGMEASVAIRTIVAAHVDRLRRNEIVQQPIVEINLDS